MGKPPKRISDEHEEDGASTPGFVATTEILSPANLLTVTTQIYGFRGGNVSASNVAHVKAFSQAEK